MDPQNDSIEIAGPWKRTVSPENADNVDSETLSKRRKVSEDSEGSNGTMAILTHPGPQNHTIIGTKRLNGEKSVCRYLKPLQSSYSNTAMLNKSQALPDSIPSTNRPCNLYTNDSAQNMSMSYSNIDKLKILTTTAEAHENSTCHGNNNPSTLTTKVSMTSNGGNSILQNSATYESTIIQTEETHSSSLPTVKSVSDTGSTNPKTKQISYTPNVPMNKEQLTAWRREARRVRNRQSAAASRQKIRDRIEELESQVLCWKRQYNDAIGKVEKLEQLVKQRYLSHPRK